LLSCIAFACDAIGGLVHQQPSLMPGRFQPPSAWQAG
jgi:hypothetical protein